MGSVKDILPGRGVTFGATARTIGLFVDAVILPLSSWHPIGATCPSASALEGCPYPLQPMGKERCGAGCSSFSADADNEYAMIDRHHRARSSA